MRFSKGQKVTYLTEYKREHGMIKSLSDDGKAAFVVYHCNNDWEDFENYTGARTNLEDLRDGWIDENGEPEQTEI